MSVRSKYSNSDSTVPEESVVDPAVRRTLLRDNRKLQPAEIDELVQLYEPGLDLIELGRRFGMHRHTARSHLLRRGIKLRPQYLPLTSNQRADMVAAYESGMSTYRLAKDYGISPDTVRRPVACGRAELTVR
jgi:DNA-directed RNA polymerase specialized sigma24 family protein